jgi:hypothetical protein
MDVGSWPELEGRLNADLMALADFARELAQLGPASLTSSSVRNRVDSSRWGKRAARSSQGGLLPTRQRLSRG